MIRSFTAGKASLSTLQMYRMFEATRKGLVLQTRMPVTCSEFSMIERRLLMRVST